MESDLSRREFLERTALAAGVAGTAALPASTILAEAAQANWQGNPLPAPRNIPIDHFVILMMENRSFDHYFGWLRDADGKQRQSYPNAAGQRVPDAPLLDARHRRHPVQGLRPPRPRPRLGLGPRAAERRLPRPRLGQRRVRAHLLQPGRPRLHPRGGAQLHHLRPLLLLAARLHLAEPLLQVVGPVGRAEDQPIAPGGNNWETIFDRAIGRGLTARYYASDLPFAALFGARAGAWINPIARYYDDCFAGTLPNITIVDPPFNDGGGGDGLSADEHPLGDVRLGQAFMADVVNAFVRSPNYRRGALFVIYDEWGGFFDHVRPPRVPDDRASTDPNEDFGQMGFRVPAVAVSPYARRAKKRWPWERDRYGGGPQPFQRRPRRLRRTSRS